MKAPTLFSLAWGLLVLLAGTNLSIATTLVSNTVFDDWSGISCPGETFAGTRSQAFNLSGDDLIAADLSSSTLNFVDLSGANLMGANLSSITVESTRFENANLEGADLSNSYFLHDARTLCLWSCGSWENANFRGADLSGSTFARGSGGSGFIVDGADFTGADLRGVTIEGGFGGYADYTDALMSVTVNQTQMTGRFTNFSGTLILGFVAGDFSGGNHRFSGAGSADGNFDDSSITFNNFTLFSGGTFINATMSGTLMNSSLAGDFTDADFSGMFIGSISDLGGVYTNAEFINTTLQGANLSGDFSYADFTGSEINFSDFNNAEVTGANFSGADLSDSLRLDRTTFDPGLAPSYDPSTDFTNTGFDPVAAGWTLIPEPSRALLTLVGLGTIALRRRR